MTCWTKAYRGHLIRGTVCGSAEDISWINLDTYDTHPAKTILGAKRAITRYVMEQEARLRS